MSPGSSQRLDHGTSRTWPCWLGAIALLALAACKPATDRQVANGQPAAATTPAAATIATTRSDFKGNLPAGRMVVVDNPYGDVHARFGGFEDVAEVHAVAQQPSSGAPIALSPRLADEGWIVAPRLAAGRTVESGQRLDLSVLVPEGHALRVVTHDGLIDVRGLHGDVDVRSDSGDISLRGIRGAIHAQTTEGGIEAALGTAPRGAEQRLATTTGEIRVAVDDHLDAAVEMATSAQFATDYSIDIRRTPGEEPDKHAHAVIGANTSKLVLDSRRGEIRLLRRSGFTAVGGADAGREVEQQQDEDSDSD